MTGFLEKLSVSFLAAASVFTMAGMLSAHRGELRAFDSRFRNEIVMPARDFARAQDELLFDSTIYAPGASDESGASARIDLAPPGPNDARDLAHVAIAPMPRAVIAPQIPTAALPDFILPDLPQVAQNAPSPRAANLPPADDSSLTPAARDAVIRHFQASLAPDLLKHFELFLYVSKAAKGPLAQRLYVFKKDGGGQLRLAADWAASTGRETYETSPLGRRTRTDTPRGYYELDPGRMYQRYHSHSWDQSMPWSMFFNWEKSGVQTGLAIHAATGADIARLGSRASAGCVHISPEHAEALYKMIRADYRGPMPRFAYDSAHETMSNNGELMRDASGRVKMTDGYKVLVFIEDYAGQDVVAALY